MSDSSLFELVHIVSNGRGGWLCSACGGGIRREATTCKHCQGVFVPTAQVIAQAHTAYQEALQTLKANPTNADLRERALKLGRLYSSMTRSTQGSRVTIYDEMALMNDIGAATAGANISAPSTDPVVASIEDRLRRLEELRAKGLLSDQEAESRRQRILDEI